MEKEQIQNLIKTLIEKINLKTNNITVTEEEGNNVWFSVEVNEPHLFIKNEGEAIHALNHIIRRLVDAKRYNPTAQEAGTKERSILVDINDFQKHKISSIRAVAHMMSERARYFKSNIEVDPMSSFDRRIVHEFLSDAVDLKTESTGFGPTRRVVIKYIGNL